MKKREEKMIESEERFGLRLRRRASEAVTLQIPAEALASLQKVAASRDMSVEALMKLYIGHGLRQDLAKVFADRVLERTAEVLTRHIESEEERAAILKEIRDEMAA